MNPRDMHSRIDRTLQELEVRARRRRRRRKLATAGATAGLLFNLNCGLPMADLYGVPTYGIDWQDASSGDDADDAGVDATVDDAAEVDLGMGTLYGFVDAG